MKTHRSTNDQQIQQRNRGPATGLNCNQRGAGLTGGLRMKYIKQRDAVERMVLFNTCKCTNVLISSWNDATCAIV